ncbi:hypothetical protein AVEN_271918-1 [Araneus ventricosus]|uniref:Uncharacterized protein n=1 Tax=Araneus ventricosus TaxID=182803 RepID=A0A4Y2CEB0_ARAVE|nr:hypothetical protein AVEN_271918-1 [Araneus ventricosus]
MLFVEVDQRWPNMGPAFQPPVGYRKKPCSFVISSSSRFFPPFLQCFSFPPSNELRRRRVANIMQMSRKVGYRRGNDDDDVRGVSETSCSPMTIGKRTVIIHRLVSGQLQITSFD